MKRNNVLRQAPINLTFQTSQQSIPIYSVHEDSDIIESYPGCFVRVYELTDNNYLTAPEEEQRNEYETWKKVLNSMDDRCEFQLVVNNQAINQSEFIEKVTIRDTGDEYDYLRKEMNDIITNRALGGKNGIEKQKYLSVGTHLNDIDQAVSKFHQIDAVLDGLLKGIGSSATALMC